jgi:hypothetical protein
LIVLCASVIVAFSLFFAPNRGLFWNTLLRRRQRRRLHTGQILANLYRLAMQHDDPTHAHHARVLQVMGTRPKEVNASLVALAEQGLVRNVGGSNTSGNEWALTEEGVAAARKLVDPHSLNPRSINAEPVQPEGGEPAAASPSQTLPTQTQESGRVAQ